MRCHVIRESPGSRRGHAAEEAWWVLLNVGIALALMLFGVFGFSSFVLGFHSNVAIAWIGTGVASVVINKPLLKVSPSYVEFKRAHLYQINPVGFGSMVAAVAVPVPAFFGAFGPFAQAFSPYLAPGLAFVLSPVLALATRGKYYVAREGSTSEIPSPTSPATTKGRAASAADLSRPLM